MPRNAVARDVMWLGAATALFAVEQLVFRAITLADLPVSEYGRLSLVLSIYAVLMMIGASGVPNTVARFVAGRQDADSRDEAAIIGVALRVCAIPTAIAATTVGVVGLMVLDSTAALPLLAFGCASWIYAMVIAGALRARHRAELAAGIQGIAGTVQCIVVAALWAVGTLTLSTAVLAFVSGHGAAFIIGCWWLRRSSEQPVNAYLAIDARARRPTAKEFISMSAWIAGATFLTASLPVAVRAGAALESYALVAVVDVALVVVGMFQRLGGVVLQALLPHHSRAGSDPRPLRPVHATTLLLTSAPFICLAAIVVATPVIHELLGWLELQDLAGIEPYLAMALVAAPSRLLYGLTQSKLIASNRVRFLGVNALLNAIGGTMIVLAFFASGYPEVAFACFTATSWIQFIRCNRQLKQAGAPLLDLQPDAERARPPVGRNSRSRTDVLDP